MLSLKILNVRQTGAQLETILNVRLLGILIRKIKRHLGNTQVILTRRKCEFQVNLVPMLSFKFLNLRQIRAHLETILNSKGRM